MSGSRRKNSVQPPGNAEPVRPSHQMPAWLGILLMIYLAHLILLTVSGRIGADRWWLGALNHYLPQLIWAVPGILLAVVTLRVAWKWTWAPLMCIAWVAGPLMGLCWPIHPLRNEAAGLPLRVMTWNVKYATHDKLSHMAIVYEIERNNPAVVLLQDANGVLNGLIGEYFQSWNVRSDGQYVVASRLPLGELQVKLIPFPGEEHTCVRTRLQLGGATVTLYNVHLESPRWGLNALRTVRRKPWYLPDAVRQLETNMSNRFAQVQALREHLRREQGPVIVAGDLNSADSSQVCAALRDAGLHDAFAEGGTGYGYTYGHFLLQHRLPDFNASWIRIDHIMMSPQLQTRKCWTGTGTASDHRPVVADLLLTRVF